MDRFSQKCDGFLTAVFFDTLGETIDYHSYLDPYLTRLIAAHHGILYDSTRYRLNWLKMGKIEMIEIFAAQVESVTIAINEEYFITLIVKKGANTPILHEQIAVLKQQLCGEI